MVGIHFGLLVYSGSVGIIAHSAERTVGYFFLSGFSRLPFVHGSLSSLIKDPYIQQSGFSLPTEDEFKYAFAVLDIRVGIEFPYPLGDRVR